MSFLRGSTTVKTGFNRSRCVNMPSCVCAPITRSSAEGSLALTRNEIDVPHVSAPLLPLNAAVWVTERYPSLTYPDIFAKRRCTLLWERSYGHEHQSHSATRGDDQAESGFG